MIENTILFSDREGRIFEIREEICAIEAWHNNEQVGSIGLEENESGFTYLYSMDVNENYQRLGIGSAMMKLVSELYGKNIGRPTYNVLGGSNASSSSGYFTDDGAAFVRSCIKKGILDDIPDSVYGEPE